MLSSYIIPVTQNKFPWIVHSPLFSRICVRSLNSRIKSRENWTQPTTGDLTENSRWLKSDKSAVTLTTADHYCVQFAACVIFDTLR